MAAIFRRLFDSLNDRLALLINRGLPFLQLRHASEAADPELFQSPHMRWLRDEAEDILAVDSRIPRTDRFRPALAPSDGPLLITRRSNINVHYTTSKVFIKRQAHPDELWGWTSTGDRSFCPASLQFIARHTTIPVPEFLGVWKENGLWHVKMAFVHGAVALRNVDPAQAPAAVAAVEAQLEADILPQLRRLKRSRMGCADPSLPVVPPHRIWKGTDRRVWSAMPRDDQDYVYCHTDLGRQNIMINPATFAIVSIVDWETVGYFPPSWELPLWRAGDHLERFSMTSAAVPHERTLIKGTGLYSRLVRVETQNADGTVRIGSKPEDVYDGGEGEVVQRL